MEADPVFAHLAGSQDALGFRRDLKSIAIGGLTDLRRIAAGLEAGGT